MSTYLSENKRQELTRYVLSFVTVNMNLQIHPDITEELCTDYISELEDKLLEARNEDYDK